MPEPREIELVDDGGTVITDRGRRKLEIDRELGRVSPSL